MQAKEYIDRRLKAPKQFFDWCYSQIHTIEWENKKQKISSNRKGCYVEKRKLTSRTHLDFFDKYYLFVIILVTPKRIEIQSYSFWSSYINGKQNIECKLTNFEVFEDDKNIQVTNQYNEYCFGLSRIYVCGGSYTGAKFYPNGFEEKIKSISELKYLKFKKSYIDIEDIRHCYKYRYEIEFLQKINARKLADEVMYQKFFWNNDAGYSKTVDMRTINRNWLKQNKKFFKNSDKDFMSFELEKRIKARNGTVVPGIEKYLTYRDIKHIPEGVGVVKFQNWIIKNDVDFKYYQDYLSLLKDLKLELNENLICPKNLKKAHDEAVKLLNELKREVEEKEYSKRLKQILKLEKEIQEYAFIVPKKIQELVIEGKALHHCVGGSGYLEKHRKGITTIIFVRKKDDKKRPLYTMEFKNNHIIQMRGKHNQGVPQEVKNIADIWLKQINQKVSDH